MRILKVTRCFYPALSYGGPIPKLLSIAKWLVSSGHKVTVYSSNVLDACQKMSDQTVVKTIEGIEVVYFNTVLRYRWDGFQPDIFERLDELRQFDVIHVYGFRDFLSTVACLFAGNSGRPYVVEPMGMLLPISRSIRKKKVYDWFIGRRIVERASKLIATSDQEAEEMLGWGVSGDKIVVRRNGLDLSEFEDLPPAGTFRRRFGIAPERRLILFLGRISRKKNPALLMHAFAELQLQDAVLAIVGPDDDDGSLQELLQLRKRLNVDGSVLLTGPLFGRDRLAALVDADVFVLPSSSENFANAAAEAMACGTPVIISRHCGIAPMIRQRAGLVIEPEKEPLKEALSQLLSDERLRRHFSENALALRPELSWDEPMAGLERLYREIASSHH